jgi:hypothetical protein
MTGDLSLTTAGGTPTHTRLLIVADGDAHARAVAVWLGERPAEPIERVTGFYAAVAALGRHVPIVVMDAAVSTPRDEWQLAQLRPYCEQTTVVVVGEEPRRGALAGALRAELTVPSADQLPPLRELVTGPAGGLVQPDTRRTRR